PALACAILDTHVLTADSPGTIVLFSILLLHTLDIQNPFTHCAHEAREKYTEVHIHEPRPFSHHRTASKVFLSAVSYLTLTSIKFTPCSSFKLLLLFQSID